MKPEPADNGDVLQIVAEHIRGRRTIKLFHDRPVSRELILDAIEAARWAPSHHVTEPWHFYLLGPETVRERADARRYHREEGREDRRFQGEIRGGDSRLARGDLQELRR